MIRLFETGAGTLWIYGSDTEALGNGQIRADQNSRLRLGDMNDESGFSLPYDIQCRGGVIEVTGNDIRLAGSNTIFVQTQFNVEGSLTVDGLLTQTATGGGSGIVKNGSGAMTLTGANTYVGTTTVNEGTLTVNGSVPTQHLIINPQGSVRGVGAVGGNATVLGTLSPGNNVGIFQSSSCQFSSRCRFGN